jgi:peptide chain release factor 3
VGQDALRIGDTLTEDRTIVFNEIPRFAPECFTYLNNPQPGNAKKFQLGIEQLLQEGVVQMLMVGTGQFQRPLLTAVGPLQFEVVQYRLKAEYGAESRLEPSRWKIVRWWRKPDAANDWTPDLLSDATVGTDRDDQQIILFTDEWALKQFSQRNAGVELSPIPWVD